MSVKLGIIGLGRMGKHHARVAQMIPDLTLFALADSCKQNFSELVPSSTLITNNYHELLNLVDAVIIATPTPTHYQITTDALSAGVHVLLEKPITPTINEATKLFNLAIQKNKVLQIGQIERFNPAFIQYKKEYSEKPFFIESRRKSRFSPHITHDSVILDLMIHDIDLVLQLIDSPIESINVIGKKIYSLTHDISSAEIEFKNGTHAFFHASRIAQSPERIMNIHTQNQITSLNFIEQSIETDQTEKPMKNIQILKENGLLKEITHFINTIKSTRNYTHNLQDLATLELTLNFQKKLML